MLKKKRKGAEDGSVQLVVYLPRRLQGPFITSPDITLILGRWRQDQELYSEFKASLGLGSWCPFGNKILR